MAKDFPATNPKATKKTVVLTLELNADSMAELYGRLATIVASVENSADVKSVEVKNGNTTAYRGQGLSTNF